MFRCRLSRTASLQSNTLFHLGAFMLPFDGGIMNQFTCYMVRDTEFTGEKHDIIYTHDIIYQGDRLLSDPKKYFV